MYDKLSCTQGMKRILYILYPFNHVIDQNLDNNVIIFVGFRGNGSAIDNLCLNDCNHLNHLNDCNTL